MLGIDQSGSMLARVRQVFPPERFPGLHYAMMGLQENDFQATFDGVICMDALEHVCPEDWPRIVSGFYISLRPGGMLYITVDAAELGNYRVAYERANTIVLPVVFGEVVDELARVLAQAMALEALDEKAILGEKIDLAVYHFHPSMEQVCVYIDQAKLAIEEEVTGTSMRVSWQGCKYNATPPHQT